MKKIPLLILVLFLFINSFSYSQVSQSVSESRKMNMKKLLDYRFKGGFYSFEKLFLTSVSYPDPATQNCIIGITIASFEVDCDGNISLVTLKNPLHYGIDEQISGFFQSTRGKWNTCKDDRYTRFEIPIQFTMKGTETDSLNALLIYVGDNPGYACNDDDYYLKRAKKELEKGKGKRAISDLDILIKRNPYNNEYYEMKKKAISMSKKKKKKKK
ncbi:MAG: hypothetical protein GXO86_11200 [Chlorobi bacterium]|nr:hypothetical protein [Chlorobiota bacterium]